MNTEPQKLVRIPPKEPGDPSDVLDKIGEVFLEVGAFLKRLGHIVKGPT